MFCVPIFLKNGNTLAKINIISGTSKLFREYFRFLFGVYFKGGIGALLGTTGGYLVGFLFTALAVGIAVDKFGRKLPVLIVSMVLGILLCYTFGTAWFVLVYTRSSGPIGVGTALGWCVLPYLLPDAVKLSLAALLTGRLYPILQKGRSA